MKSQSGYYHTVEPRLAYVELTFKNELKFGTFVEHQITYIWKKKKLFSLLEEVEIMVL